MRPGVLASCLLATLAAAGCGGARQDADEPSGEFKLEILSARFPGAQTIAQSSSLVMRVRNAGNLEVPNLAVTVQTDPARRGDAPSAFGQNLDDAALASRGRPVWILDQDPAGGQSAYTDTWSFGRLRPGQTKIVRWRVTAVRAGRYTLRYRVAPGLDGKARNAAGTKASGSLQVTIDDKPRPAHVDAHGNVVHGD